MDRDSEPVRNELGQRRRSEHRILRAPMLHNGQNLAGQLVAAAWTALPRIGWGRLRPPQTLWDHGRIEWRLLVGVVLEQRPDLFAVALQAAGVTDMLRYHRFTSWCRLGHPAWVIGEREDFPCLYNYSPLHNIEAGACYPAILVTHRG